VLVHHDRLLGVADALLEDVAVKVAHLG
jgi:hypothetical protein